MAEKFPLFDEDMDIIQKLGDTPGPDNNLDWKELQAQFDKGGNLVKAYLNTLVGRLNSVLGADGAFLSGGNLLGDINANLYRIFGLQEPTADNEASTKKYVDDTVREAVAKQFSTDGGALDGDLDMKGHGVQNIATPVNASDAATKSYVDSRKLEFSNVSVPASSWSTAAASSCDGVRTKFANVPLNGFTADMFPQVTFWPGDIENYNFSPIVKSFDGLIQIYAETAPTGAITIPTILCWR